MPNTQQEKRRDNPLIILTTTEFENNLNDPQLTKQHAQA